MKRKVPAPPKGSSVPGRRLWNAIVEHLELDEHELVLLVEMVRTVDLLEKLDACWREDGEIIKTPQGPRAHPAVVEARQQRITLARLQAQLRLPAGVADGAGKANCEPSGRPQRRGAPRGVYGITGVVS